jgi:sulfate/thiosulfate transport system permease protein
VSVEATALGPRPVSDADPGHRGRKGGPGVRRSLRAEPDKLSPLTRASGLGLGVAMLWFSLLVLIPLTAVVITASAGGWSGFWRTVTNEQTSASIQLTVVTALLVTLVNVVMGTAIAWVLVRDRFFGKRILEILIDIPFALPTIVAGLVLLSLYGPRSPLGINIANTRPAVFLAFLFVTLPFVVRTVQPVLAELDRDAEEAAESLGASRVTVFWRIILPSLTPAIAAGAALSFARGVSEYGSLVLLSGNLPGKTEVTSVRILSSIENDNLDSAAAVAAVLLVISLIVIVAVDVLQRRLVRRG